MRKFYLKNTKKYFPGNIFYELDSNVSRETLLFFYKKIVQKPFIYIEF